MIRVPWLPTYLLPTYLLPTCTLLALTACASLRPERRTDREIDPALHAEIIALDKRVFAAYRVREASPAAALLSDHFRARTSVAALDTFLADLDETLAEARARIVAEQYVANLLPWQGFDLTRGGGTFRLTPSHRRGYLVWTEATVPDGTSYYIVNVYGEEDDRGWGLDYTLIALHRVNGYSREDLYERAERHRRAGEAVPTWAYAYFAHEVSASRTGDLEYAIDVAIDSLYAREQQTWWPLPDTLEELAGAPVLTALYLDRYAEGLLTVHEYVTGVDFGDSTAMQREYEAVAALLSERYAGYGDLPPGMIFDAMSHAPDDEAPADYRRYLRDVE